MGLVAKNPQEQTKEQGSGALLGAPPAYATGVVHHDAVADDGTVTHHAQRFEAGQLVEWSVSGAPGPWALVRPGGPTERCPHGMATPAEVEAVKVRIGDDLLVLPPLDDLPAPAFDLLETVPDATARLRFELTGTPVGRILCDIRYRDGKRPMGIVVPEWPPTTGAGEPAHDAPEMQVRMSFRNYLKMRTGELTALEAIADGGDVGNTRWTLLLLLHGLIQSEPYVAAYRGLPVLPDALGWWGEAAPFVSADAAPA